MTPEGKIKERVKRVLKDHGAYKHMPVQNGMGEPALDFHVCSHGRYGAVECKAPGGEMTPRQKATATRVEAAGGRVFLVDGVNGQLEELETWLSLTIR